MSASLEKLVELGVLSQLDRHYALALDRLVPGTKPEVLLGAAFASRAIQRGHVCAHLPRLHARPLLDAADFEVQDVELPPVDGWCEALRGSPLVGNEASDDEPRPLVLDPHERLYLFRYARYERLLAKSILARTRRVEDVDAKALREALERLFDDHSGQSDKQRLAALVAVLRTFTVISGGPGTGKTYTVAKILALLQEQAKATGHDLLRIRLVAPTGKAAQRLGESIELNVGKLNCADEIKAAIPRDAATIHRALGYQPRTPTRFRHDADHPLPADVVLVDEASMVDVALMAKLVAAVPKTSRLILLGDKDQLASVEAGAILGDIYGSHGEGGYSKQFAQQVEQLTGDELPISETRPDPGIHDCMIHLDFSHRYGPDSGIAALADAVKTDKPDDAIAAFGEHQDISLQPLDARALKKSLGATVLEEFGALGGGSPAEKLGLLANFRILCAHRRDRFGVNAVNRFVEEHLSAHGKLQADREWYEGRPIMITQNDYQLELFNGDVGVIARADDSKPLAAFFVGRDGKGLRQLPPARLPPHETVFAMTIHKSQGSEFERVAMLLPEQTSRVLTRELVYTGITRAKCEVTLYGSRKVLRGAIERRIDRPSGLRDALWGR